MDGGLLAGGLEEELELAHVRCPSCGKIIQPLVGRMRERIKRGETYEQARRSLGIMRECCLARIIRAAQMPEEFLVDDYASRDNGVTEIAPTSLLVSGSSGFEVQMPQRTSHEIITRPPMEPGTYRTYRAR